MAFQIKEITVVLLTCLRHFERVNMDTDTDLVNVVYPVDCYLMDDCGTMSLRSLFLSNKY